MKTSTMIAALALIILAAPAVASDTRQLTDKEVDAYMKAGRLGTFQPEYKDTIPTRDNSDPDYQPAYKLNLFKPLSKEARYEELAWQLVNVVDLLQTVQIAKNPQCYEEVGTASMFVGSHPSVGEAIAVNVGFGLAHYFVTRAIDSLTDRNPDYLYLQRGWQIVSFVPKAMNSVNNQQMGLGLTSSRSCGPTNFNRPVMGAVR